MTKRIGRRQVAAVVGLAMAGTMAVGAWSGRTGGGAGDAASTKAVLGRSTFSAPAPTADGLADEARPSQVASGDVAAAAKTAAASSPGGRVRPRPM